MSSRPVRLISLVLLVVLGLSGCATAPRVWQEPPALSADAREALNLQVYDRAADRVADKFFDASLRGVDWPAARARHREAARTAKDDETLYRAINALLAELGESHTVAVPPREAFQERHRTRVLTGFTMRPLEGQWVITRVLPGSAAEAAGVRRGWIVRSRDGAPLERRAPRFTMTPGQAVQFEFVDELDQVRAMTLVAGPVDSTPAREARHLEDGTLYVRFERFDLASIRWLSAQLEANRDAPAAIIDVRDNPGGLLMSARLAIAEFFPRRVEIGTFVQRGGREKETRSLTWGAAQYAGPVAVLVNGQSASSAEIFAHVLQHHRRAVIVGQTTAGAVIAALEYALPDRGRLQVPILDYLGLDGKRLEGAGVRPDVPVMPSLADLRQGYDRELAAAREALHRDAPVPTS